MSADSMCLSLLVCQCFLLASLCLVRSIDEVWRLFAMPTLVDGFGSVSLSLPNCALYLFAHRPVSLCRLAGYGG